MKETKTRQPVVNRAMMQELEKHNITFNIQGVDKKGRHNIVCYADLTGIYSMLENLDNLPWKKQDNREKAKDLTDGGRFYGGNISDLLSDASGNTNMRPFEKSAEKIESSDLMDKITMAIGQGTGRTIAFTEDDGEYDIMRRGHDRPYMTIRRARKSVPVMAIDCDFSISCRADAKEINRYGSMVYALASFVEQHGIETKILFHNFCHNMDTNDRLNLRTFVTIKEPGRYLAPSALAATFQARFYRIAMFILFVAAMDTYSKTAAVNLGQPEQRGKPVEFTDGTLKFNPSVSEAYSDEIEKEVIAAVS